MKVVFSEFAAAQFLAALEFIRRDSPAAARNFRDKAVDTLERLVQFPLSGRHLPEFPALDTREVIVPPYRFFYRVHDETILIVAAWHGAQLPANPDEPQDDRTHPDPP